MDLSKSFQKRRQEQRDIERAMMDKKKIFLEDVRCFGPTKRPVLWITPPRHTSFSLKTTICRYFTTLGLSFPRSDLLWCPGVQHKKDAPKAGYFSAILSPSKCCRSCGATQGLLDFSTSFKTCLKCKADFCEKCVKDVFPDDVCAEEFCGIDLKTISSEGAHGRPASPLAYFLIAFGVSDWNLCELCGIYFHDVQILRWRHVVETATEESRLLSVYGELKALRGEIERTFPHYEYLCQSILDVAPEKYDKAYAAIYSEVKDRQTQLWRLMKQYQVEVKKVMALEPIIPTEATILRNLKSDVSNYVALRLPVLKKYQSRIGALEVEGLSDVLVLLVQLENDMRALASVWETFGKAFDLCAQRVRSELQTATSHASITFEEHYKMLEATIQAPGRVNDLKGLSVGTVIRKVAERIRAMEKVIIRRGVEAPIALDVLRYLAKTLEDTYDKSTNLSNWKSAK